MIKSDNLINGQPVFTPLGLNEIRLVLFHDTFSKEKVRGKRRKKKKTFLFTYKLFHSIIRIKFDKLFLNNAKDIIVNISHHSTYINNMC